MFKFYLKRTGEELKIGETVELIFSKEIGNKKYSAKGTFKITDELIDMLIAKGAVEGRLDYTKEVVDRICEKMKITTNVFSAVAKIFYDKYPYAIWYILLKEFAIEYDKYYPDHITKCDHYWYIDKNQKNILAVNADQIKDYKQTGLFRKYQDAYHSVEAINKLIKNGFEFK